MMFKRLATSAVLCGSFVFGGLAKGDWIGPYVNEGTVLVLKLDVDGTDADVVIDWMGACSENAISLAPKLSQAKLRAFVGEIKSVGRKEFTKICKTLRDAGIDDAYVRVNIEDVMRSIGGNGDPILTVFSLKKDADSVKAIAAIKKVYGQGRIIEGGKAGFVVMYYGDGMKDSLKYFESSDRADLRDAVESEMKGEMRLVAQLPVAMRNTFGMMLPKDLPGLGVDAQKLIKSIGQIKIDVDLSKTGGFEFSILSDDVDSSAWLKKTLMDVGVSYLKKHTGSASKLGTNLEYLERLNRLINGGRFVNEGKVLKVGLDAKGFASLAESVIALANHMHVDSTRGYIINQERSLFMACIKRASKNGEVLPVDFLSFDGGDGVYSHTYSGPLGARVNHTVYGKMSAGEKRAWHKKHCFYIYVVGGVKLSDIKKPSERIAMVSGTIKGEVCVAYADSSVRVLPFKKVDAELTKQTGKGIDAWFKSQRGE